MHTALKILFELLLFFTPLQLLFAASFTASDITADTGLSYNAVMGDVDGDGDLDIYVANYNAQNKLWINDGSGNFTASDITGDTGLY